MRAKSESNKGVRIILLFLSMLFLNTMLHSQASVKVEVSADTIAPGELVEVTYTIENGDGRFEAPDFQNIPVVSGPNSSSSYMVANGKKTSSQSYSYILRPAEEGKIVIPAAFFRAKDQELKIDPVDIVVLKYYSPSFPSATGYQIVKTDT